MKHKIQFVILILLITSIHCFSQNIGYGGKRVILKKAIFSGVYNPLVDFNVEVITGRHTSLSIGYHQYSQDFRQRYGYQEYQSSYIANMFLTPIPDKGHAFNTHYFGELRAYVVPFLSAPKGIYGLLQIKYCKINVIGNYWESLVLDLDWRDEPGEYFSFNFKNINAVQTEFGLGYQYFLNTFMTLDFNTSLNFSMLNFDRKYSKGLLSAYCRKFGSNMLRAPIFNGYLGEKPVTQTLGISVNFQLGFMLF